MLQLDIDYVGVGEQVKGLQSELINFRLNDG